MIFNACTGEDNPSAPIADETNMHMGHEYVDLGLPSGALWSSEELNVNGKHFFAWGETEPKETFFMNNYQLQNGRDSTLTKYCTRAEFGNNGFVDGLTELLPEDDPVVKHWGGKWQMPCWEEFEELSRCCVWERVDVEGGDSYYVGTSKMNGNKIFIPMTGAVRGDEVVYVNQGCCYWSSTLLTDSCGHVAAWQLAGRKNLDSNNYRYGKRTAGHIIRPVIPGNRASLKEAVDLGLPSGTKWAKTNIGAMWETSPGVYVAWGETKAKKMYNFGDYKYCNATNDDGTLKSLSKYVTYSTIGTVDNLTQLDCDDDVALQEWGNGWRMPTLTDFNELLKNCTITNDTVNNVAGTRFTGPNGNSIFLPWHGTMFNGKLEYPERAYYWSSTLDETDNKFGEGLFLSAKMQMRGRGFARCSGRLVRPVRK